MLTEAKKLVILPLAAAVPPTPGWVERGLEAMLATDASRSDVIAQHVVAPRQRERGRRGG